MLRDSAAYLLPVATHVVLVSCKGAVAIALLLVCRKLFADRLSAQFRHGLWLVVLAALLLPVGFELPIWSRASPIAVDNAPFATEVPAVEVMASASMSPSPPDAATGSTVAPLRAVDAPYSRILPQSWLVLLWAAVVVVLATVPLLNLYRYRRITARAASVSGPALDLLLQCRQQMRVLRTVRLLETADIATPAVFAWLSPTLLLPPGLHQRFGETQLRHVFMHELAHVQRHDVLVNWIATCAQILHWFNPLVWYGLQVMRADMEQACDARVLGLLSPHEHADYGRTLIRVLDAFPGPAPAQGLGVVEDRNQLKERIMRIAKFSSRQVRSPALATMLLLGLASVAATQPHITSAAAENVIESVSIKAPPTSAAVLMTQAAQPVPVASPTAAAAAAVPKQPSSNPGYTPDEAQEAERAFSSLGQIVRSGFGPDSKLLMSSLGLYLEDPSTVLPALNQLMDENRQREAESSAALCRRKDVVTIEMFMDLRRERVAEKDSWQVRKWREFLASLPMKDRTPQAGEPRTFQMSNVRLGTWMSNTGLSFDQDQFNAFIKWRDGGCQVAVTTGSAPDARLASPRTDPSTTAASIQGSLPAASQMSPSEQAEER